MTTTVIANIAPLAMKATGEGRSVAFRTNPNAQTAGAMVGAFARSLQAISGDQKLTLADILNAAAAKASGKSALASVPAPSSALPRVGKGGGSIPKSLKDSTAVAAPVQTFKAGQPVGAKFEGDSYAATIVTVGKTSAKVRWASNDAESIVPLTDLGRLVLLKGDQFFLLADDGFTDRVEVTGVKADVVAAKYVDNGDRFDIPLNEVVFATADKDRTNVKAATKPAAKPAAVKAAPKATAPAAKPAAKPAPKAQTAPATATKGPRSAKATAAAPAPVKVTSAKAAAAAIAAAPSPKAKPAAKAAPAPVKAAAKPAAKPAAKVAAPAPKAKTVPGTKGAATVTVKKGGGRGAK